MTIDKRKKIANNFLDDFSAKRNKHKLPNWAMAAIIGASISISAVGCDDDDDNNNVNNTNNTTCTNCDYAAPFIDPDASSKVDDSDQ
ncbi:MAG: hypothetical protein JXR95_05590 [Deltaproteobacteria bacterium]|nr:hypothetical protein [Deltaproteobacteria bacterium]